MNLSCLFSILYKTNEKSLDIYKILSINHYILQILYIMGKRSLFQKNIFRAFS